MGLFKCFLKHYNLIFWFKAPHLDFSIQLLSDSFKPLSTDLPSCTLQKAAVAADVHLYSVNVEKNLIWKSTYLNKILLKMEKGFFSLFFCIENICSPYNHALWD